MAQAQAQDVSAFDSTPEATAPPPTHGSLTGSPGGSAPRAPRLLVVTLVLQAALGVGLAVTAVRLGARLEVLSSRSDARAVVGDRTAAGVEGLVLQARAMEDELVDLRQAVASHAREEAIFLKALILKPSLEVSLARRIAKSVQQECVVHGRDPNLVLAIIATESDFNPKAVSYQGAVGLMQVMPHWRQVLGLQADLAEPEVSIRTGIEILGFYQSMYRDLDTALTAYNRGPGAVDGALMRGASPANGYAAKVLATYQRLNRLDAAARP